VKIAHLHGISVMFVATMGQTFLYDLIIFRFLLMCSLIYDTFVLGCNEVF
jgi:hypothetical protein